ncbi:hypothetical protein A3E49_03825 [Candidatus Saccharibacteria bacterium RIFCSPHIGHO2_12_FULL_49_19]|nr:MAG: hypothetical protein A3E49_03825 [Candidatus Saccharibacteria bacterium RIFCSPHIGHO2_12_FULL_49_19]OGL37647.1 MAG: hypothetical protein A3B63_01070 [Candidatus Saccharibacteria bacterium RIFCSPLOWO2_01_FULL_49_22]
MKIKEAFRFCPRCGSPFQPRENYLECNRCGLHFYFNPKPCTAIALINDRGEYLLVKRAVDPGKGLWDLPGGFVEEGETFEENAVREVQEELGLSIKQGDLKYVAAHTEPYLFQDIEYLTLAACFVAKYPDGESPKPADDVADFHFFKPGGLPTDKFAFAAMHKDFEAIGKFLKTNKL